MYTAITEPISWGGKVRSKANQAYCFCVSCTDLLNWWLRWMLKLTKVTPPQKKKKKKKCTLVLKTIRFYVLLNLLQIQELAKTGFFCFFFFSGGPFDDLSWHENVSNGIDRPQRRRHAKLPTTKSTKRARLRGMVLREIALSPSYLLLHLRLRFSSLLYSLTAIAPWLTTFS